MSHRQEDIGACNIRYLEVQPTSKVIADLEVPIIAP